MNYTKEQISKMSNAIEKFSQEQILQIQEIDGVIASKNEENKEDISILKKMKLQLILSWDQQRKDREFKLALIQRYGKQLIQDLKKYEEHITENNEIMPSGYYNFYLVEDVTTHNRKIIARPCTFQQSNQLHQFIHEEFQAVKSSLREAVSIIDSSLLTTPEELTLIAAHLGNVWNASISIS